MFTSLEPHEIQASRLLCPWNFPGIEPMSPALAGIFFTTEPPGKPYVCVCVCVCVCVQQL